MAESAPARTSSEEKAPRRMRWSLLGSALGPFLALACVILFFGIAEHFTSDNPGFLTEATLRNVAVQTATVAVAALGMTVIIIGGGIDLSAGTALALCATVLAWCLKEDVALLVATGDNVASAQARLNDSTSRVGRLPTLIQQEEKSNKPDQRKIAALRAELGDLTARIPQMGSHLEELRDRSKRWTPWTPTAAVMIGIATGVVCGCLNGLLVSFLKVVPFIVTLGTMQVYLGLAKIIAKETTVRPDRAAQVPQWMVNFTSIREQALIAGFPTGVWLVLGLAVVLAAVLRYTVFSRHVFAIGSNEATARLCGINVPLNKIAFYTLGGFFVGVAGIYQFSRLAAGNPTSGIGLELKVIAAVVIGGGSLSGGRGSVLGSLTGAAIIFIIGSGCTQLGISNPIQDVILGVIVVAAVTIDQLRQRRLGA